MAAFLAQRPVDPDNPDNYASLSFCKNRLFAAIRTVDPETDFLAYTQGYLREYGQPKVNVRKQPWTGPKGGDITSFDLVWVRDGVRREVTLIQEGRTGSGELRYVRTASVAVHFDISANSNPSALVTIRSGSKSLGRSGVDRCTYPACFG